MMFKWLKISTFIILHVAAGYFFGVTCDHTGQAFLLLLAPTYELLNMLTIFLISISVVVLFAGLVAVLIEPLWIKIISFILASGSILVGWGTFTFVSLALIFFHLLVGIYFSFNVGKGLRERIRFSIKPINENKGQLILALLLLVCGSIYEYGKRHIAQNGFEIPESYFLLFMEPMKEQALAQVPPQERQAEEAKIEQQFSEIIEQFQKNQVKPIEAYIPIIIAASLFFTLFSIVSMVAFLPLTIISMIIKLLQMMKVVKSIAETKEVERLVLD